ncbi:hypothetical protein C8Q74DRAFT_1407370, partial [Fomes fomentarius]
PITPSATSSPTKCTSARPLPHHIRAIRLRPAPILHRHRASPSWHPARTIRRRRLYIDLPCRGRRPWMLVACSWQAMSIFTVISLFRRYAVEDGRLWKRFGDAWTAYLRTVA